MRMRASDQDRNEAVLALSDHFAEGRLDQAEFDVRMRAATEATYLHDLDPLFADLPRRAASVARAETGRRSASSRGPRAVRHGHMRIPVAPLVFALILAAVVTGHGVFLFFVFPLLWFAGGMARRRAWRHMAELGPQGPGAPHWR
jgi:hypothetical protein